MTFKLATMCSGIGAPEQAIKELGVPHENVFACEIDKYARQTYLANFQPGEMLTDMTKESWIEPDKYADLVIAGIPCQSFSLAGKRLGENDARGLLIYDFIRYIKAQQPKVFIIENVKGLLSDAGGLTISKWRDLLGRSMNGCEWFMPNPDSCGYNLHMRVLNAKNYGLPQNRERVFIIGIRPDLPNSFRWPKGIVLRDRLIDLLEPEVDEKYYLSDAMLAKISGNGKFVNQDTQASQIHNIFGVMPTVNAGTHGYALGYVKFNGIFDKKINNESGVAACLNVGSNGSGSHNSLVLLQDAKHSSGRIYDSTGIGKTVTTNTKGGMGNKTGIYVVPEPTKQGYSIAETGDSVNISNPNSKTRHGRVGKGIANTVETGKGIAVVVDRISSFKETENSIRLVKADGSGISEHFYNKPKGAAGTVTKSHKPKVATNRIRRLTPLECMRLQGFPDSYIKVCSETQQYKQAGNSIPVHMIKAIIRNLLHLL